MSKLAKKITTSQPTPFERVKAGPPNLCRPLYGEGDLEDWQAVEEYRRAPHSWREVQAHVDALVGVERPISLDKFRRHWRRRCGCWPSEIQL